MTTTSANKRPTKAEEKQQAIAQLREMCKPGTKVYTVLRSVSRSGMSRHISVMVSGSDGISDITWLVGRALEYVRDSKDGGLKVTGCGMDMGFHLVNSLSYCLHGMHSKGKGTGDNWFEPREADNDNYKAGYSLQHEWL